MYFPPLAGVGIPIIAPVNLSWANNTVSLSSSPLREAYPKSNETTLLEEVA